MAKRYARLNWQNTPSVATPINATNLNKMDKGIDDLDNAIEAIYSKRVNNVVTTNEDTFLAGPVGKVLQDQVTELNKNIKGFISLGMLGTANSEDELATLIDNIAAMHINTNYICLVGVNYSGSTIFTAMGHTSGGTIQILGLSAGPSFEVQRALSYYGAPVYRQKRDGAWDSWKRYN